MSDTDQPEERSPFERISLVLMLVSLALLVLALVGGRQDTRSPTRRIINNLRQIDAAKAQWALEHHQTGAVALSRQDIGRYIGAPGHGWIRPAARENYTIGLLTEPPEAELTRPVSGLPKGTRVRLNSTNGPEVRIHQAWVRCP